MCAYQQGRVASFEALVRRHQPAVYRFLVKLLGDGAQAEEVSSEVFFKLHKAAPTWEPRARLKTFLFTLAYHTGLDALRHRRARGAVGLYEDPVGIDRAPGGAPSRPDREAESRQLVAVVDQCLAGYPPQPRAVFLLYYRAELTTTEIADALGLPVGTVRAHLSEIRRSLSAELRAHASGDALALGGG